ESTGGRRTTLGAQMDSAHAFDFPLHELSPAQHSALDAALGRESISHEGHGTTLSVDIAYEPRGRTPIAQARNPVPPPPPPPRPTPGGVRMARASGGPGRGAGPAPGGPRAPPPAYGSPYGYGYGYGPVPVSRPTNGLAVASLVCGIIGLFSCTLLTGIPAI